VVATRGELPGEDHRLYTIHVPEGATTTRLRFSASSGNRGGVAKLSTTTFNEALRVASAPR
jgi:hypothetical protein